MIISEIITKVNLKPNKYFESHNHFIKYISSPKAIQNEIIEDIKSNKPNFILYNSDLDLFGDSVKRLPKVDEFIRLNYSIRNKFLQDNCHQ